MDRSALENELAKLYQASFSWALTCCQGDPREAEDVLQTVYLKIIDGRASFEGRSSYKTWLFSIIRMTARENRRKAWLRAGLFKGWQNQTESLNESSGPGSLELAEKKESRSQVLQALEQLPVRQREALELVFYHGLTISEAALAMKISIGSARVHYDRGKSRLKDILEATGTFDE